MDPTYPQVDPELMDRAWMVRSTLRRVILVAALIQAATPDRLDQSLLSQSLPPAPLFVASRLSPDRDADRPPGFQADRGDVKRASDTLCEPSWPDLALRLDCRVGDRDRMKLNQAIDLPAGALDPLGARHGEVQASGAATSRARPWLLLRLIC